MYIFDEKNRLDCSNSNPNFTFLVIVFWQLVSDSLLLVKDGDVEGSKSLLSQTIEKFVPKEPPSLNMLRESEVFFGDHSEDFSKIYFNLLALWEDIQSEGVAFLTGNEYKTDNTKLESFLDQQRLSLEDILYRLGVK